MPICIPGMDATSFIQPLNHIIVNIILVYLPQNMYLRKDSTIEGHLVSEMQMQVSGFGDVQNRPDGNFQFSDKLKSVMVPMVSSELCQSWYGSDFEVLPDQICAGHAEGKRDACVGDSGGPMVRHFDVEGSDVYYQSKSLSKMVVFCSSFI